MNAMWNKLKSGIAHAAPRFTQNAAAIFEAIAALALTPVEVAVAGDARLVKIDQGGVGQSSRSIVLGLNKAAIVELPVASRGALLRKTKHRRRDRAVRVVGCYLIKLCDWTAQCRWFFNESGDRSSMRATVERGLVVILLSDAPDARIDVAVQGRVELLGEDHCGVIVH